VSTNGPSSINNNSSVAGTCSANSQTYTCSGLPSNAIWNTVSSYSQTWNGSSWAPANSTTTYNTTTSTTSCNYKCNTNYTWNGSACNASTQSVSCGGSIINNAIASTATTYTQTWNGSTWAPFYTWSYGGASCGYTCNTGYTWDGTKCYKLACTSGTYNSSTNKCDSTSNYSCNYAATGNSSTTCVPQTCEYYIAGGDGSIQYDDYGNPITTGGSNLCCNGGSCGPSGDVCTTNTTYSCPSGGSLSGTTCLKTCTSITSVSPSCATPTLNGGIRKCY
ncbi:MAG: hypothetical protein PHR68_04555, partial [Candidatus Gracilibacteria bacterium]|nr:hypothetical protein [Candidatus Gracilibacteria bacterium]